MTYDTQTQADRLAIRQGLWLAQQPFATSSLYGAGSFKRRRAALGLDSLTDGAAGSSYRPYLQALLDAKYGDPGIPAGPIDSTADGRAAFGQSGFNSVAGLSWTDARRIKSAFGSGRVANNTTTGSADIYLPTKDTDITAISIWMEFTAAGQSFNIKQAGAPGSTTQVAVSGDNYPLNVPAKITFPLNSTYNTGVNLNAINTNGANDLFGWWREYHYNTPRSGVELVNLGIGGTKTSDWAGLDDTAFRRWMRIVQPDMFILIPGMNDRGSALSNGNVYADKVPNSFVFAKNLEIVLDRIPQSVKGMLVVPSEPSDVASTGIGYYPDVIKSAAEQRGWAWHDDRAVLGNYATANAAGDMAGDGVHPSAQGNSKRAVAYETRILAAIA